MYMHDRDKEALFSRTYKNIGCDDEEDDDDDDDDEGYDFGKKSGTKWSKEEVLQNSNYHRYVPALNPHTKIYRIVYWSMKLAFMEARIGRR